MKPLVAVIVVSVLVSPARPQGTCPASLPNEFKLELIRLGTETVTDKGGTSVKRVYGDIAVNNVNFGRFYENPAVMIPTGTYVGALRYQSNHNFVLSSCGAAARRGDFLIEVSGVRDGSGNARSDILFHPGELPSQSRGCILFGARKRDAAGELLPLGPDYPLAKIRREFYGTDDPLQCPNKRITIVVSSR
ncbi:MAG: hypothetical protein JNK48_29405 [Bryobacterales bacterium]|nr:hypothetical protein [Bryobacterales bacterium]